MQEQNKYKKKILLSAYACSAIHGSEPGNGWSWATGLAREGYEVWCFTNVEDAAENTKSLEALQLPNLHLVFVELQMGLDKHLLDTSSKKIYLHYKLWFNEAAKLANKMHSQIKFDLGHHVTFGSLQQGSFLWKVKGLEFIFGPAGGGQEALPYLKEYFGNAWKIERIRSFVSWYSTRYSNNFKRTILGAKHILVTNADTLQMAKSVKGVSASKIFFVPDTAVPKIMEGMPEVERKDEAKLKMLWVGRMLPRKGLNLVLEALSKVPSYVDYTLTIVGGGEQFHLIDGWIEQYGLDKTKLNIRGQIPFFEVTDEYKKANSFIFCSLRDSFAAQLTEAMAFGLPIIVLNIHGATLGVPDNCGIKVTPVTKEGTVKDIANAITVMFEQKELRHKYARNAYDYSKNNTWHNRIKTITEQFYK